MIFVFGAVTVLVAAFVLLSPRFCPGLYSKLIFHPQVSDPNPPAISEPHQDVFFKTPDGLELHGMFLPSTACDVVFLFSHGNAGTLPGWAAFPDRLRNETGASAFVYDYRGFGKSEGKPTLKGIVTDGQSAHDYLVRELHIDPAKIIPFGWSIGSIPALRTALSRKCGGVVLLGAFASFSQLCYELMPFLKWIVPPVLSFKESPDNRHALAELKGSIPTVIAWADHDEMMRRHHADDLYQAASGDKELLILPDCTHGSIKAGMPMLMSALKTLVQKLNS